MEQTAILTKSEKTKELGLKPVLVKDVVLISPGIWTGVDGQATNYSADSILNGFQNTDWSNMNLFLDHKDSSGPAVGNWGGFIRNPRMLGSDLIGDVEVWHPMISMFIKEAKAKFAVSMTTEGIEKMLSDNLSDYEINRFVSFSIVHEPGCKISWLPKVLSSGKETKTVISSSIGVSSEKELSSKENITKEVKKMESEKETSEKAVEEVKELSKEVEAPKELAEVKESEAVKALSSKVDGIVSDIKELTAMVEKSLAAPDKKELAEEPAKEPEAVKAEEPAEEPAKEEAESGKELADIKASLEVTQKELAALKDAPDRKSLAIGGNSPNVDANSSNSGMLGYLRETANLNY